MLVILTVFTFEWLILKHVVLEEVFSDEGSVPKMRIWTMLL